MAKLTSEELHIFLKKISRANPDFYDAVCKRDPSGYGLFGGAGLLAYMNEICETDFPDWNSNDELAGYVEVWDEAMNG